jgi:hypothetical protein
MKELPNSSSATFTPEMAIGMFAETPEYLKNSTRRILGSQSSTTKEHFKPLKLNT